MKLYNVQWEELHTVTVYAENEQDAQEKIMNGEYDNANEDLEITGKAIAYEVKNDHKLLLNIVTCGQCGEPFGHRVPYEASNLTCPYCNFNDDISSFPDLYYLPNRTDSVVDVSK